MTTTAFNISFISSGRALVKSGLSRNSTLQNRAPTRLSSCRTTFSPPSITPSNSLQWFSNSRRWNSVGAKSHPQPTTSTPGVAATESGAAKQATSTTAAKKPTATAKNPGVGEKSHPQPTTSTPGVAATESGTAKQAASTTAAESTASKAGDAAKQAAGTVKSPSVGAKSHPQPTTSSPDVAATESGAAKQATSTTAAKKPAKNPGVGEKTHPQPTTSKPGVAATESGTAKQATSTTAAESTASKAGDAAKKSVGTMKSASARAEHAGAEAAGEQHTMDWNSYFQLRRTRRNYERVFMVPCAVVGLGGAGYYFANKDFDPTPIFGMDQVLVYAAGTVAAGIVGLAMGPVVGNMVFRTTHSKAKPLVDRMDTEFYKHIVRNRADPTANSVRNPVPDYYGEKIKSVSEYRKWLRKQREYRRKATFFVGVD